MTETILLNVDELYVAGGNAKLSDLERYVSQAIVSAGEGNDIVLSGPGPIWLYLKIAHALHGKARKLIYRSPVTGDVVIFDHTP